MTFLSAFALLIALLVPKATPPAVGVPHFDPGVAPNGSTPHLIAEAAASGEISDLQAWEQLAYAFLAPERVEPRFLSTVGWHGTIPLMNLRAASEEPPLLQSLINDFGPDPLACGFLFLSPATHVRSSEHFDVHYIPGTVRGGLTVADYVDSLETSYDTEVTQFGWAAPPVQGKYQVNLDMTMIPGLYGYVASEGNAGDNPNTSWNDVDASYSCMGLNSDYTLFPGTPQDALDATTAHEFNHSIQFGYGALSPRPAAKYSEGSATWMEDMVFDDSNDSYNYLHPNYAESMTTDGDSYEYFIVYRALTEPFDTDLDLARSGEDLMQHAIEWMSRNNSGQFINGLEDAYTNGGLGGTLKDAFADASGRLAVLDPCNPGPGTYCLEEANGYRTSARAYQGFGPGIYNVSPGYASSAVRLTPGSGYNATGTGDLVARLYCVAGGIAALQPNAAPTGACTELFAVGSSGRSGGTLTVTAN